MPSWMIVALILLVVFLAYRAWLSLQHLNQLSKGLPLIQKHAFNNIYESGTGVMSPTVQDETRDAHYLRTVEGFGVAYTITRSPDGEHFIHHISGKAPGKSAESVVHNMLLIMSTLIGQFKAANIEHENRFAIEQSDLGTQHLEFQLSAQQQSALRAVVEGDRTNVV